MTPIFSFDFPQASTDLSALGYTEATLLSMHWYAGRVSRVTAPCHMQGKPGRSVLMPPDPIIFRHTLALSPALTDR